MDEDDSYVSDPSDNDMGDYEADEEEAGSAGSEDDDDGCYDAGAEMLVSSKKVRYREAWRVARSVQCAHCLDPVAQSLDLSLSLACRVFRSDEVAASLTAAASLPACCLPCPVTGALQSAHPG